MVSTSPTELIYSVSRSIETVREWKIYLLLDTEGTPVYVGRTYDLTRRLRSHRRRLGYMPGVIILESGHGNSRIAEKRWIHEYMAKHQLLNISPGAIGPDCASKSTREKLRHIMTNRPGSRAGALRGLKKGTEVSRQNWLSLSPEERTALARSRSDKYWDRIPISERSRMATERNLNAWAQRHEQQRREIGAKIKKANQRRDPRWHRKFAEAGQQAVRKKYPDFRERARNRIKSWWASLTPEKKAAFVEKRKIAVAEGRRRNAEKAIKSVEAHRKSAAAKWAKPGERERMSALAKKQMQGDRRLAELVGGWTHEKRSAISKKAWKTKRTMAPETAI